MLTLNRTQTIALVLLLALTGTAAFLFGFYWEATYIPTFWTNAVVIVSAVSYAIVWFACFVTVMEKPIR